MKFGLREASDDSSSSEPEPEEVVPRIIDTPSSRPTRRVPFRKPTTTPAKPPLQPFVPKPVRIVKPPKLSNNRRKGRLVTDLSSDEDENGNSSDEGDSEEESDEDSEEEEWPVGPIGSVGIGGWRRKGKGRAKDQGRAEDNRLYGAPDAFEVWDEQSKATSWATANRSFHLSLARSLTASRPPLSSRSSSSADVSSIQNLLSSLALQQTAATTKLVESFESRNKALWSSIEASIRAAEQEEGEKQRLLEENRRKREEAEAKAQAMREEERKKVEAETKQKEEAKKVEEGKREEERKKVEAEQKRRAEEEAKKASASRVTAPPSGSGVEGSPQAEWERWTAKMTHIKQSVLPTVSQNPAYRKDCFTAKRSITPKIGQLTSSLEATTRIIGQLDALLTSLRAPSGGNEPYLWTLNHLAKALVKQAETEVTAKIGTAYPLGRVVVGLMARGHTELGEVLMARLVKKCFWITGWWPAKQPGQTDADHLKTLGHAPPSSSESLVQYASRMSGLIALYASILSTSPLLPPQGPCPPSSLSNIPPHFRPSAGWRWLILILRPLLISLEPTPLLLATFLEVAGESLLETYGKQFGKFLEVLLREGIREKKAGLNEEKSKSSVVRLTLWLEEWEKTGRVEVVKGKELDA